MQKYITIPVMLFSLFINNCKVNDDLVPNPATEAEGRNAMKTAISQVMNDKGFGLTLQEDVTLYTNKPGTFDVVGFVDTDNDGNSDFWLGSNYITDGESIQGINDGKRVKTKEFYKSELTTSDYINQIIQEWARNIAYTD